MTKIEQKTSTWLKKDIQKRLECALWLLVRNDWVLFKNKANERSLMHMLAFYLNSILT